MSSFYSDNDDLRFYVERGIDWAPVVAEVEALGGPADERFDTPESAVEFYTQVLELVGAYAAEDVAPHTHELDTQPIALVDGEVVFPPRLQAVFDGLCDLGLHGLCVPRELGGMNAPLMVYMLTAELLARADVSVMTHHSFHGGIAMALLVYSALEGSTQIDTETMQITGTRFADEIAEIAAGRAWGSMDLTEPDAGSDLGRMRTVAVQDTDDPDVWRLTGEKIFITSGHGRYHLVIARTEDTEGLDALSLFLVDAFDEEDNRTVFVDRVEEKLGHHASATVTVRFDASPGRLIGDRGQGFKLMLLLMNNARIGVGFEALGLCEAARRMAHAYATQRVTMGKPIARHELIAEQLDDMDRQCQGLRALAVHAAWHEEMCQRKRLRLQYVERPGTPEHDALSAEVKALQWQSRLTTPLLKYMGAEAAVAMARQCLQIHGGYGYTTEYGAEKLLRDALVLPIYEGTSQIQALMATKDSLLGIVRDLGGFFTRIAETRWRAHTAGDPRARRVAALEHTVLVAQRTLMGRIVRGKLEGMTPLQVHQIKARLAHWDVKQDFAPALLHAERLTQLMADVAVAGILLQQVAAHPDRGPVLDRWLESAEPRSRDLLHRIQTTGGRLLATLADTAPVDGADGPDAAAQPAQGVAATGT